MVEVCEDSLPLQVTDRELKFCQVHDPEVDEEKLGRSATALVSVVEELWVGFEVVVTVSVSVKVEVFVELVKLVVTKHKKEAGSK